MTDTSKTPGQLLFEELAINLDEVPFEHLSNYTAVEYFLTIEDEPHSDATNLTKVNRYLASFNHLCEVSDWERASLILFSECDKSNNQPLYTQLYSWGYHSKRIELHHKLLGRLNSQIDTICLRNIGNSYMILGQHEKTIELYQKSLVLARKIGDRQNEWSTLRVLSHFYYSKGYYSQAIDFYEDLLSLSEMVEEPLGKGEALLALAGAYHFLGKTQKAIGLFNECFTYIQILENQPKKCYLLATIGSMYDLTQEYNKAIECYEKSLDVAQSINYQQIGGCLANFGKTLIKLEKYSEALDVLFKAREQLKRDGIRVGEATSILNIAEIYYQLKNLKLARNYYNQALELATNLDVPILLQQCQEFKKKLLSKAT